MAMHLGLPFTGPFLSTVASGVRLRSQRQPMRLNSALCRSTTSCSFIQVGFTLRSSGLLSRIKQGGATQLHFWSSSTPYGSRYLCRPIYTSLVRMLLGQPHSFVNDWSFNQSSHEGLPEILSFKCTC